MDTTARPTLRIAMLCWDRNGGVQEASTRLGLINGVQTPNAVAVTSHNASIFWDRPGIAGEETACWITVPTMGIAPMSWVRTGIVKTMVARKESRPIYLIAPPTAAYLTPLAREFTSRLHNPIQAHLLIVLGAFFLSQALSTTMHRQVLQDTVPTR